MLGHRRTREFHLRSRIRPPRGPYTLPIQSQFLPLPHVRLLADSCVLDPVSGCKKAHRRFESVPLSFAILPFGTVCIGNEPSLPTYSQQGAYIAFSQARTGEDLNQVGRTKPHTAARRRAATSLDASPAPRMANRLATVTGHCCPRGFGWPAGKMNVHKEQSHTEAVSRRPYSGATARSTLHSFRLSTCSLNTIHPFHHPSTNRRHSNLAPSQPAQPNCNQANSA